jgi:membrane protein implicated in regulation of membrane protease activity
MAPGTSGYVGSCPALIRKEKPMLWLILGIVLLVIAIAGGTIVHPILFVLAILALLVFFAGSRSRTAL